jgi:uncharacterized membrane protein (GlpM family)
MIVLFEKILISVLVVLVLSWIAENVNPRISGILSGMPLGAVLVLYFVGRELGPEFAIASTLYAIASITASISFALGYYYASRLKIQFSPLVSSVCGLICFFVVVALLNWIHFDLVAAIALTLTTLIIVAYTYHTSEVNKIQIKVKMTFQRLLFRSGLAAVFVVAITIAAQFIGPRWSGLLLGFPMTFLPFILVIHMTYSAAQVRTIIRNFPLGLIGLLCFLVVVNQTIPELGVNVAIVTGLGCALTYLMLLSLVLSHLNSKAQRSA